MPHAPVARGSRYAAQTAANPKLSPPQAVLLLLSFAGCSWGRRRWRRRRRCPRGSSGRGALAFVHFAAQQVGELIVDAKWVEDFVGEPADDVGGSVCASGSCSEALSSCHSGP